MSKVAVLLMEGFEEGETFTIVDVMRRLDIPCYTFYFDSVASFPSASASLKAKGYPVAGPWLVTKFWSATATSSQKMAPGRAGRIPTTVELPGTCWGGWIGWER